MTVSTLPKSLYRCGCKKWECETIQRARNGASEKIWHRLIGTHDPRQPHPARLPVRRWDTDTWPGKP